MLLIAGTAVWPLMLLKDLFVFPYAAEAGLDAGRAFQAQAC